MLSTPSTEFLVPEGVAEAQARLSTHLRLEAGAPASADLTFYDTVDGRLHAGGLRLTRSDGRLVVLDASRELAGAPADGRPKRMFSADLPAGPVRDLLAPIVEMRALTPIARIRSRLRPLRVLDDEAKTVVRLVLEEPALVGTGGTRTPLEPRLHVSGVRGYDAALARVTRSLEQGLGFSAAAMPLLDDAVTAAGGVPGGVSSKLAVALRPDQRADSAATALLIHLAGTIEQNRPGTLADIDSEFLHDLRIAVRRSRSAQRQLRAVFPAEPLARFRDEFRWLQQVTGPTRDLDVHLLEFEELRSTLPEPQRADLEPLRALLLARRRKEQRRMVRALQSQRYEALLADWSGFLVRLGDEPLDGRPDAVRPIAEFAGERIRRVYGRIVKAGREIDDASPAEALHDLRKSGKELRYLLEFFAGIYPAEVVKPMVRTLKALQDTLGRFYDREVQAGTLRSLRAELVALDDGPAALMAMGLLVARLEVDQADARSEFAERFAAFAAKPQRALVRETFA